MLYVGDVVTIFDPRTDPQKVKWHLCVCDRRYLFLRLNSKPIWRPCHPLKAVDVPFLDHDSYVELRQLYHFGPNDVIRALRLAHNPRGRLGRDQAEHLARAATAAPTLSEEYKNLIADNFARAFGV